MALALVAATMALGVTMVVAEVVPLGTVRVVSLPPPRVARRAETLLA